MIVRQGSTGQQMRLLAGAALLLTAVLGSHAQAQSAPEPAAAPEFTRAQIDELVAPVALYPDDLLAIVLPASTYPLQVVQAARFLEAARSDSSLEPDPSWDDSVVALLNYPEVLDLLSEDLDWTWELGQAVLAQQPEVMGAVADFRARAHAAGNLRSDDRQVVEVADEAIHIRPADSQVIYVPYYEPARVVVRQAAPVYYYYPRPYPVYYYPYPLGYTFHSGFFWGVTNYYTLGWSTRHVHVHHHHHHWHPYYRTRYHHDRFFYRRPTTVVHHHHHRAQASPRFHVGNKWQPKPQRHVVTHSGRPNYHTQRPHPRASAAQQTTRTRTEQRSAGQQRPARFAGADRDRAPAAAGSRQPQQTQRSAQTRRPDQRRAPDAASAPRTQTTAPARWAPPPRAAQQPRTARQQRAAPQPAPARQPQQQQQRSSAVQRSAERGKTRESGASTTHGAARQSRGSERSGARRTFNPR